LLTASPLCSFQDPAQAEAMIGQPVLRNTLASAAVSQTNDATSGGNEMSIDEPYTMQSNSAYSTVGTPIKLAPSTSAFRKNVGGSASKPTTPQTQKGWGGSATPSLSSSLLPSGITPSTPVGQSPSKSVVSQMSDLIFGW
jgi:nuclear pore complex protein Nup53